MQDIEEKYRSYCNKILDTCVKKLNGQNYGSCNPDELIKCLMDGLEDQFSSEDKYDKRIAYKVAEEISIMYN